MREKKNASWLLGFGRLGEKRIYCFSLWLYDKIKMTHHPHCYIHVTQLLNKEMAVGAAALNRDMTYWVFPSLFSV